MTADLHTHILHGMDDGAKTIADSITLLKREIASGIDAVALTSHFCTDWDTVDHYVERRDRAFLQLQQAVREENLPVKLIPAAEILYSSALTDMDLSKLCYAGTKTLLIELLPNAYPAGFERFLFQMGTKGYTILIAHIDRYPYLLDSPRLLCQWVEQGCYCHVNASAVLYHRRTLAFTAAAVRHGLVHLIASDTHSIEKRPPLMREAFSLLQKRCQSEQIEWLKQNPALLLQSKRLLSPPPSEIKRLFGKYL